MISAPHELSIAGIYLPPAIIVIFIAYALAVLTARSAVRLGFHRFIVAPALFELSLTVIYGVIIGSVAIPL